MRLKVLDAHFIRMITFNKIERVRTLEEAQGIMFLCPRCFEENGGAFGTHNTICWFRDRGVPDEVMPGPGRWAVAGTSLIDLTLSPSVNNSCWHGFVQHGSAV